MADHQADDESRYAKRAITAEIEACIPFGGAVREWTLAMAQMSQVHPLFHTGLMMAICGHEANRRGWRWGAGREHFRFWLGLVAPSGIGKSFAMGQAKDFHLWWRGQRLGSKAVDPWLQLQGSIQGILESLSAYHDPDTGITPAILTLDEIDQILEKVEVSSYLNQLFDGRRIARHERQYQREGIHAHVERPMLNGAFTTTEASLRRVVQESQLEGGLFGRILWMLDRPAKDELAPRHRDLPELRQPTAGMLNGWFSWMDAQELQRRPEQRVVTVEPSALRLIEDVQWEQVQESLAANDRLSGVYKRLHENTAMIACMFALQRGHVVATDRDAMRAANLAAFCRESVEQMDHTLATSTGFRRQTEVERYIRRSGPDGVVKRDLYRHFRLVKKELDEVVDGLRDQGVVEWTRPISRGGRPASRLVHRDHLTSDMLPADEQPN